MNAKLLFIQALSPLHAGCGQGVGLIDLPITREKATGIPYLPGSSLKGVLRDTCKDRQLRQIIFGPDTNNAEMHAGAVQFSDQRLLALPVRSVVGTFAWVLSPYILQLFSRDWRLIVKNAQLPAIPVLEIEECLVSANTVLVQGSENLILEEMDLQVRQSSELGQAWAELFAKLLFGAEDGWAEFFSEHFVIVHDDVLGFFRESATEIIARTRLDDASKTVVDGGLWYEEALPAESVLVGLVVASPVTAEKTAKELLEAVEQLTKKPLQLGGKATVGRGLCRLTMVPGEEGY